MKALVYRGPGVIRYEEVDDPELRDPTDAIVSVERAGICGSDLHVHHGRERGLDPGTILGHEFIGRVAAVGSAVRHFSVGDRVASAFSTSCGGCFYCTRGLSARCPRGHLFGWVSQGVGLEGAQAQRVRVPLADGTLCPIPDDLGGDEALLLCDVLPTGWHCARMAEVLADEVQVVLGLGPVGLMAVLAAREMRASRVFAVDTVPERLAFAARLGATPLDARSTDVAKAVRAATEGRGADSVMEAIGSSEAARLAFDLVRPGGTVSTVGVHHEAAFPFSPAEAYDRNLTWRIGRCPARSLMEGLIPVAITRRADLAAMITHRLPLEDGPRAYQIFDQKLEGCLKVTLTP